MNPIVPREAISSIYFYIPYPIIKISPSYEFIGTFYEFIGTDYKFIGMEKINIDEP